MRPISEPTRAMRNIRLHFITTDPACAAQSETEFKIILGAYGIAPAHTIAEIVAETRDKRACYINAPECAPFTDGVFPCHPHEYIADTMRHDACATSDYNAFLCVTAQAIAGDTLALFLVYTPDPLDLYPFDLSDET